MEEEYRPLKEDQDYLIYNDGRLYSKKQDRFLSGKIDNVGYQVYRLAIYNEQTGKKGKMLYAHQLVAEYFLPNPNNLPYVHHKDGNKLNNNVDNLQWVTARQNSLEAQKTSSNKTPAKSRYYEKNLPDEEWLPVKDDLTYEVSNMGRIRNVETNRLIKHDECQKYSRVRLHKQHYYVHRLVYCTFHNDYDLDGYVIDHIDNDPRNNKLDNLQKITVSENNYKRFQK